MVRITMLSLSLAVLSTPAACGVPSLARAPVADEDSPGTVNPTSEEAALSASPATAPMLATTPAASHARPEPEPKPAPEPEPAAPTHADLDPDNDDVLGPPEPLPDCEARLEAAGVTFKPARIGVGRRHNGVYTCGAKQVVRFKRGPGSIAYSSSPLVTCSMALALADFEVIVQEEAERILGTRVAKIDHMGTYNCREMVNYDLISEHSFANGIDLRRFHLKNGEKITVKADFRPEEDDPSEASTRFLRSLSNRLYDDDVFSVVVTPFFDRLHHNHIHIDLARYRIDGSRK